MAVGSVTVVQVDNLQGDFSEVERVFLFIGRNATSDHDNEIIPIDAAADLDELLAAGESELKTAIAAARVNAVNDNFACYALPIGYRLEGGALFRARQTTRPQCRSGRTLYAGQDENRGRGVPGRRERGAFTVCEIHLRFCLLHGNRTGRNLVRIYGAARGPG